MEFEASRVGVRVRVMRGTVLPRLVRWISGTLHASISFLYAGSVYSR